MPGGVGGIGVHQSADSVTGAAIVHVARSTVNVAKNTAAGLMAVYGVGVTEYTSSNNASYSVTGLHIQCDG
jgi:hypothetical protein